VGTYGSLGAAIGFMTWMWISVIAVLLGAEFDQTIAAVTAKAQPQAKRLQAKRLQAKSLAEARVPRAAKGLIDAPQEL
jgi:membrane protein